MKHLAGKALTNFIARTFNGTIGVCHLICVGCVHVGTFFHKMGPCLGKDLNDLLVSLLRDRQS